MASTNLLDIPWFAFDVPEKGTPERKQMRSASILPNCVTGWEPALPSHRSQGVSFTSQKYQNRPRQSTQSYSAHSHAPEYVFRHYNDIERYIEDYRAYHTHRNVGYPSVKGRYSIHTASVEGGVGGDSGIDSNYFVGSGSLRKAELLHILKHSHRQRLSHTSKPTVDIPHNDVEAEEGEDDPQKNHDTRSCQPKVRLLNRPTSSSSAQSSSVAMSCVQRSDAERSKSLSAGVERVSIQREGSKCAEVQDTRRRCRSHASSHATQVRNNRFAPGNKYFVGSTLTRTPQNGLLSAQPQINKTGGLRPLHPGSTHSAISNLKHQVWFDKDGRAYVSLANQLNVLFKCYKQPM